MSWKTVILFLLIPILFLWDVLPSLQDYSFSESWDALWANPKENALTRILYGVRIPRGITAIVAGGALATAGLLMQTYFRNPLAGPSVLGLTSGASLGVALLLLGASFFGLTGSLFAEYGVFVFAGIGALLVLGLINFLATKIRSNATLLIVGLMIGYIASSLVTVLSYFAEESELKNFVHWGFGSFSKIGSYSVLGVIAFVVFILVLRAWTMSKSLNGWLLGDRYARSIGVPIKSTQQQVLLIAGLLTAIVTAVCGPIAFLGLAVPHLARGWEKTNDHRKLLPATIVWGIFLALGCDIVANLTDYGLPINAVTAAVGAPIVIGLLIRNRGLV